jgi:hypothetical protein
MRDDEGGLTGSVAGKFIGGCVGLAAAISTGIGLDKLLQSVPLNMIQDTRIALDVATSAVSALPFTRYLSRLGEYIGYRGIIDIASTACRYVTKPVKRLLRIKEEY